MGDDAPSNGDLSVCLMCNQAAFYDDTTLHGLRKPTREEKISLLADPMMRAYDAIN